MPVAPYLDVVPDGLNFGRSSQYQLIPPTSVAVLANTWTVPDSYYAYIVEISGTLSTSVAVANRQPRLRVTPSGNPLFYEWQPPGVQAASTAKQYWFGGYIVAPVVSATQGYTPLPLVLFPPGSTITLSVATGQAADAWLNVQGTFNYYLFDGSGDEGSPVVLQAPNPV